MKRLVLFLILTPLLLGACTSTETLVNAYESDELISVRHNQNSDCTLLIYRDPIGQTRHVFRKHGVFEFGLTFQIDGAILLKERGRTERAIEAYEASRVTQRMNALLQVQKEEARRSLSNSNT